MSHSRKRSSIFANEGVLSSHEEVKRLRLSLLESCSYNKSFVTSILHLPFEIHLEIARYLDLKDAMAYSKLCIAAHDAVYYMFAHKDSLNFESVMHKDGYIDLCDEELLQLLHAHIRCTSIINFCVAPTFSSFKALCRYMKFYWGMTMDRPWRGHPTGSLTMIHYPQHSYFGGSTKHQGDILSSLWSKYNDSHSVLIDKMSFYPHCMQNYCHMDNWSTSNVDAPYYKCDVCNVKAFASSFLKLCCKCAASLGIESNEDRICGRKCYVKGRVTTLCWKCVYSLNNGTEYLVCEQSSDDDEAEIIN